MGRVEGRKTWHEATDEEKEQRKLAGKEGAKHVFENLSSTNGRNTSSSWAEIKLLGVKWFLRNKRGGLQQGVLVLRHLATCQLRDRMLSGSWAGRIAILAWGHRG